jgi:hypothetical protein
MMRFLGRAGILVSILEVMSLFPEIAQSSYMGCQDKDSGKKGQKG